MLTVVEDDLKKTRLQAEVRVYLDKYGIQAHFVQKSSLFAPALFETCHEYEVDFIIMGGYSQSPLRDLVLGASVDQALHESKYPILICR